MTRPADRHLRRKVGCRLAALAVTLSTHAIACGQGTTDDALAILRQCMESGRNIRTAQAELTHTTTLKNSEMDEVIEAVYSFKVAEANRIALIRKSGASGTDIVCNGTTMFEFAPSLNAYQHLNPPSAFHTLFDHDHAHARQLYDGTILHALSPMFSPAGRKHIDEALTLEDTSIALVQDSEIDGVAYHHVRMRLPVAAATGNFSMAIMTPPAARVTIDLHISKSEPRTIRRVECDLAHIIRLLDANPPGDELQYGWTIDARAWKLNEELGEDAFAATPPQDAQLVRSLMDAALGNAAAPDEPLDPNSVLAGKPSPHFAFLMRDGSLTTFSPEPKDHASVLVFWASWFEASIAQVATANAVLAKLGDDRIRLYAVNYQEDADVAKNVASRVFSDSTAVGLDLHANAGDQLLLHSLPWTVIIDRDSTVRAILVGKPEDSAKQLEDILVPMLNAWKENQQPDAPTDSDG